MADTIQARHLEVGDWIVVDGKAAQVTGIDHVATPDRYCIPVEYTIPGQPCTRRWWFSACAEVEKADVEP